MWWWRLLLLHHHWSQLVFAIRAATRLRIWLTVRRRGKCHQVLLHTSREQTHLSAAAGLIILCSLRCWGNIESYVSGITRRYRSLFFTKENDSNKKLGWISGIKKQQQKTKENPVLNLLTECSYISSHEMSRYNQSSTLNAQRNWYYNYWEDLETLETVLCCVCEHLNMSGYWDLLFYKMVFNSVLFTFNLWRHTQSLSYYVLCVCIIKNLKPDDDDDDIPSSTPTSTWINHLGSNHVCFWLSMKPTWSNTKGFTAWDPQFQHLHTYCAVTTRCSRLLMLRQQIWTYRRWSGGWLVLYDSGGSIQTDQERKTRCGVFINH